MSRKKSEIVQTFQVGAAVVDICRGVAQDGHAYLYYENTREWLRGSGNRPNYSDRFYGRNAIDHCKAIQRAAKWMDKNPDAADPERPMPKQGQQSEAKSPNVIEPREHLST